MFETHLLPQCLRTLGQIMSVTFLAAMSSLTLAEQSLEQAASDPTASLMNVQVSNWYTSDFHNLNGESANTVLLRSAIPFTVGEQKNIFRVSAPIVTDSPFANDGLGDMTVFDLMTFDASWGRWGAGVVGLLPAGGSSRGAEKWGVGPAIGFVASQTGMLWGLFNQNIFTVAGEGDREDVNVSTLQPIFNLALGNGWSTGFSDMTQTYDWEGNDWASLPLGIKLQKLQKFSGVPVQLGAEYEYNFADDDIGPEEVLRVTVKIIFPGPG